MGAKTRTFFGIFLIVLSLAVAYYGFAGLQPAQPPSATPSATPTPSAEPKPSQTGQAQLQIVVIDVGQGDSILINAFNATTRASLLVDAGDPTHASAVLSALARYNATRGLGVLATHGHADHTGGMAEVFDAAASIEVTNFYYGVPSTDYDKFVGNSNRRELSAGDSFSLGPAKVQVLNPERKAGLADGNANSVVLKVSTEDGCALFMGDADFAAENAILAANWNVSCAVLKVGHHGSSTSSGKAFLGAVAPKVALISVGAGNSYGHPTKAALDRLSAVGASTYRTDQSGDLEVTLNKSGVFVV